MKLLGQSRFHLPERTEDQIHKTLWKNEQHICFGICLGIAEHEWDFVVASSKQDKFQSTWTQRSETHHCSPECLHIIVQRTKWFSGERCHWITRFYFIFHSDLYTCKAPDKVNEIKLSSAEVKWLTSLIRLFPKVAPKISQNCKFTTVTLSLWHDLYFFSKCIMYTQ